MIPIILITTDELRKDALGCYGGKAVKTPNIDSLAQTGMCMDKAYTPSPWCLPARCSVMTGLLPHNNGAYSNFASSGLNPDIPNLFTLLKSGGYSTSLFGKCHFAPVPYGETKPNVSLPYDKFREYYVSLGIDHLALQDDKQVSVWFCDDYTKELNEAGYLEEYRNEVWNRKKAKSFTFPGPAEWHPDAWTGRKAVEYIENYESETPPFIWVSFSGPHYPFDPPKEYLSRVNMDDDTGARIYDGEFDSPSRIHHTSFNGVGGIDGCNVAPGGACKNYTPEYWTELRRNYFANVALIDDWVGEVLKAVSSRFEESIVIFTADHGEMLGNHGLWGKNNCAYEDVLNVPFLIKAPGAAPAVRPQSKIMTTDILPTFLNAAGLPNIDCDGEDIFELLKKGGREYVYAEGAHFTCVSDGKTKYVKAALKDRHFKELFDLSDDANEIENRIDNPAYAAKRTQMAEKINELFINSVLK